MAKRTTTTATDDVASHIFALLSHPATPEEIHNALVMALTELFDATGGVVSLEVIRALLVVVAQRHDGAEGRS